MGNCGARPKPIEAAPAAEAAAPESAVVPAERTGVRSVEDLPNEGDGCERCGCPDEEACCPAFWQDEGVPPFPILSWVFGRKNKYLNDNEYVEKIGNCGFHAADRERKALMGTALAFTVVSIIVTGYGSLSLSSHPEVVKKTAWAIGFLRRHGQGRIAYVGLTRLVMVHCSDALEGDDWYEWDGCHFEAHWWSDVTAGCHGAPSARHDADTFGYPCDALEYCAMQASANQFGALITAVTLIFALIGCLTRIRKRADTNFQKIIGTFPDMIGIFTLGMALLTFSAKCTSKMLAEADIGTGYISGPGFLAYCVCWVAAVVRFTMHAIMPAPGAGIADPCGPNRREYQPYAEGTQKGASGTKPAAKKGANTKMV